MAKLICLGGGIEGLPILERAKALGHELIVVDGNPNAPGFALADEKVYASCYDPECWRVQDGNSHKLKPDGVICCAVDAPHVAAAVAQAFGLPGLHPNEADLSRNKPRQKFMLSMSGLPVPAFCEWPRIVVKPPDSRGARGVKLIDTGGVVERWLSGPQLSTESIVQDGRVLWTGIAHRNYERLQEFAPYIIEDGYEEPYGDMQLRQDVDSLLTLACAALGWYQQGGGTVKGDWIIHEGNLIILELAARLSGGFLATHGHPLASHVDFVGYAIKLALGERIKQVDVYADAWVCQRYVFPEPGDIGRRVVSVPLTARNGIMLVPGGPFDFFQTIAIHPGDTIKPVVSHAERWGQATCTGATPEQAQMRAVAAVTAMKAAVVLE